MSPHVVVEGCLGCPGAAHGDCGRSNAVSLSARSGCNSAMCSCGRSNAVSLSATSGCITSGVVSAMLIMTHVMFFFAQLADADVDCPALGSNTSLCPRRQQVGGLVAAGLTLQVGYDARGALASGLSGLQEALCDAKCGSGHHTPSRPVPWLCDAIVCDACSSIGALSLRQRCVVGYEQTMMQFGYMYAVEDLWERDVAPTCLLGSEASCTDEHPGRIGATALFTFSFVWPHVKLVLLHTMFYARLAPRSQRSASFWLAALGKWTLLDVLVMSVIVSLDQISLVSTLPAIWKDMRNTTLLQVCEATCLNQTGRVPPPGSCGRWCESAYDIFSSAVDSRAELVQSHVAIALPLTVQRCMYSFCVAVVLSVTCSVVVDALEGRSRLRSLTRAKAGLLQASSTAGGTPIPSSASATLVATGEGRVNGRALLGHVAVLILQLIATWSALSLPLLHRHMGGPIATFFEQLGASLGGEFSLLQLSMQLGSAWGWDLLLAATMWTFVVLCPLLRPTTQLVVLLSPIQLPSLHGLSRYLSFYHALEVMLLAVPVVQVTLQIIFIDLLTPRSFPLCAVLTTPGDDTCVSIELTHGPGYLALVAAVLLHLVSGYDGSPTHKFIHRRLHPLDTPPPYCSNTF